MRYEDSARAAQELLGTFENQQVSGTKIYLLYEIVSDGYGSENVLGVYSTASKALEAQIKAEKEDPPTRGMFYEIREAEIDKEI